MSAEETRIGPWRVLTERAVYENPWISVVHHDVAHPDGSPGQYGVVRFKNLAVGVLAIDAEGMVPIVGQHRFPHNRYSWELPEGGGALSDDPLTTARRELEEETGLTASSWAPLCAFDVSNSVTDERAVCFLAWDLSEGVAAPEPSEALTVMKISFADALEKVMSGEITDSLTIVMVQTAVIRALRGELPDPISGLALAALARK